MDEMKPSAPGRVSPPVDRRSEAEKQGMAHHTSPLVEILAKIPLFQGLLFQQLKKIISVCVKRIAVKDEVVCREGDESFEIYILIKGELKVTFSDGKEFSRITPVGILGEMGVFTGERRSATVVAATSCILLAIHKAELMRVLRTEADLGIKVLLNVVGDLAEKVRRDNQIIEDLRKACPPGNWTQVVQDPGRSG